MVTSSNGNSNVERQIQKYARQREYKNILLLWELLFFMVQQFCAIVVALANTSPGLCGIFYGGYHAQSAPLTLNPGPSPPAPSPSSAAPVTVTTTYTAPSPAPVRYVDILRLVCKKVPNGMTYWSAKFKLSYRTFIIYFTVPCYITATRPTRQAPPSATSSPTRCRRRPPPRAWPRRT